MNRHEQLYISDKHLDIIVDIACGVNYMCGSKSFNKDEFRIAIKDRFNRTIDDLYELNNRHLTGKKLNSELRNRLNNIYDIDYNYQQVFMIHKDITFNIIDYDKVDLTFPPMINGYKFNLSGIN